MVRWGAMQTRARLLPALLPLLLGACGGEAEAPSAADVLARQRAASFYMESEFSRALAELEPLAEREDAALDDLVHAASVALEPEIGDAARARAWIGRARELAPDDPRVLWNEHRLAGIDGDLARSESLLRGVLEQAPDDIPAKLALASVLVDLDRGAEAETLYREVHAVGPDRAGSWYVTAVYRLFRLSLVAGRDAEADVFQKEHERLVERGVKAPELPDIDRGTFGSIPAPRSEELYPRAAGELAEALAAGAWTLGAPARQELPRMSALRALPRSAPALGTDSQLTQQGGNLGHVHAVPPAQDALLSFGEGGLQVLRWSNAQYAAETLIDEPVAAAAVFDLGAGNRQGGDGDADVVAALGAALVLLERQGDAFERRAEPLLELPAAPAALLPVDFDHEGDVDLLAVGPFGARLLRNDGLDAPGGAFTDATAGAGLPEDGVFAWCASEDLDRDNDVDLIFGGPGGAVLASNERGGRFSDASASLPRGLEAGARCGDFDGDGWADLQALDGATWLGGPSGGWRPGPAHARTPGPALLASDLEGVLPDAVVFDKEGDGAPDLASLEDGALATRAAAPEPGSTSVVLALQGDKDNRAGLGAVVEVLLGPAYRRVYWRGGALAVATHGRAQVDVVRVSWPNGVVQNAVGLPGSGSFALAQREGLIGSCPFLYTWDGERFVFISDVLGITPLGLPMAPGRLVPPDHDEYVLIRGRDLKPRDGEYVLQLTEELREVTYLDRARLDVIDHPAGVEVFPNERFTFPPFPEPHVHTVQDALAPRSAAASDGGDWTAELARDDGVLAKPFRALGGQFQGLAEPWYVELAFDPERVRAAPKLRLVLNGWLYWTDASVNMAAAGHPAAEFVPPLLQVPDGEGGWREAGLLGFPAGKLKAMVVDVGAALDREDPRLRVFTSLQLYWDSIRLAVDADDAPLQVTELEPAAAELWQRGFSKPLPHPAHPELCTFDWDALEAEPRWNQHPGLYTKLGPCRELVRAVDDRFAILGAGDALTLRFPAAGLPPLPAGYERDYLLYLDGWAKDRDPNTLEALYVEPLPFHGMSGYPYRPDERFPDDPLHADYRLEWNTRPGRRLIPDLSMTSDSGADDSGVR